MYENRHGRFTAVDPLLASGKSSDPQTFNRYVYTLNNPINLIDPSGLKSEGGSKTCSFECRVKDALTNDTGLSEDDLALAKFHIANGTALGSQFQQLAMDAIERDARLAGLTQRAIEQGITDVPDAINLQWGRD